MAFTYPTVYSELVEGIMLGKMNLLRQMDGAFNIPGSAGAGVINVELLSTVSTQTPTPGTFLTDGMSNSAVALTLGHTFATRLMTVNQSDTAWDRSPAAQRAIANKMADGIVMAIQAVLIADLKAATIDTYTTSLATTFIDYAVPGTTTTDASLIINFMAPLNRMIAKVIAAKAGAPLSDFYIVMPTTAFGNLLALAMTFPGVVPLTAINGGQGNGYTYRGIPIYAVDGTNFGGAGKEVTWIAHKEAYAFKLDGIYGWRGGVPVEDGDGQLRQTYYARYAYGLATKGLMAEISNPKS